MNEEKNFGDMVAFTAAQLEIMLIESTVERVLADECLTHEYVLAAIQCEVEKSKRDKLALLEELYNMGVWA